MKLQRKHNNIKKQNTNDNQPLHKPTIIDSFSLTNNLKNNFEYHLLDNCLEQEAIACFFEAGKKNSLSLVYENITNTIFLLFYLVTHIVK